MATASVPTSQALLLHQERPDPATVAARSDADVAATAHDVLSAWRVVHDVYVHAGLIQPNPHLMHTWPQALSPSAAVLVCGRNQRVEGTLTAVVDGAQGLPLDKVYQRQLDGMRRRGWRLTEYSLFAHVRQLEPNDGALRRADAGDNALAAMPDRRMQWSMLELMRLAYYFAITRGSTHMVIGVHPRHAPFYARAFGFTPAGPELCYAAVNNRPVVLLHGSLCESLRRPVTPFAIDYCLRNPVTPDAFDRRYCFRQRRTDPAGRRIEEYLRQRRWAG